MFHRNLSTWCCGLGLLCGAAALPAFAAEDKPAVAAPDSPAAEAPVRLAYRFQKGDVVRYETVQNVTFVSQFSGNVETATNKTETRKAYRIVAVNPDGSAELELVIEWVRMKADFGGGGLPVEFDSRDPAAKSQAKFANVLKNVGNPQRLICAPTGKVLKVKEVSLVTPGPAGSQPVQIKDEAGRDDLNFLTVFPDEPISVGKSWVEKSEIKVVVEDKLKESVELQRTYKLKSVKDGIATVSFKTSVLTPIKKPEVAIQLIQRDTQGELTFDIARGAIVTRTVDADKSVINPAGNNTAMRSTSYLLERMVTSTAEISEAPKEGVKK